MAKNDPLTVLSWGYYGWGSSTQEFVDLVDRTEAALGFNPPIFADVRISRKVRAAGFRERSFEKLVGTERYHWIRGLGNQSVADRQGPKIKIAEPKAVEELLDLLLVAAERKRRVVYFCGCQYQRMGRRISCHRWNVGSLLLKAAEKRGLDLETVEWPGGDPTESSLRISSQLMASHGIPERNAAYIALENTANVARLESQAWQSIVVLVDSLTSQRMLSGPVKHLRGRWQLPYLYHVGEGPKVTDDDRRQAGYYRKWLGQEPRRTKIRVKDRSTTAVKFPVQQVAEVEALKTIEAVGGVVRRDRQGQIERIDLWDPRKIVNRDRESRVKDHTLRALAAFPELPHLCLFFAQVTDAGLKYLRPLKRLKFLWLNNTLVTDAGMEVLTKLPALESLWLHDTSITNDAIRILKKAPQLTCLRLSNTDVTDAGVKILATMRRLTDLSLGGTRITENALEHLSTMSQLRKLELRGTRVSLGGVRQLKKHLPKAKITGP